MELSNTIKISNKPDYTKALDYLKLGKEIEVYTMYDLTFLLSNLKEFGIKELIIREEYEENLNLFWGGGRYYIVRVDEETVKFYKELLKKNKKGELLWLKNISFI